MTECYLLEKCGFFIHYGKSTKIDSEQLINTYCRGNLMNACQRLQYRNKYGVPPSDHMMPDGTMIRETIDHT